MNASFRWKRLVVLLAVVCAGMTANLHAQQSSDAASEPARAGEGVFVHAVYFWLRPDLSAEQREAFVGGLRALRGIETVRHGWIGVPAATDRPIIERTYSYALTLVFVDEAGHDAYQVHPVHDRFRDEFADFWSRVLIYDSVAETGSQR
jgi:hypothetical protein